MNNKISKTLNNIKQRIALEWIKQATKNVTKQQKITVGGTVGVLALAAILSVAPMASHIPTDSASGVGAENIKLAQSVNDTQWLIKIDGALILAVDSEQDAKAVLEGMKSHYLTEGSQVSNIEFGQEVCYEEYDYASIGAEPAWVMNVADAVDYITRGTVETKTYVVQGGDTLWDIAVKNGITPTELEQMNPGINFSKMKIGSELNLYESKPFITVRTTETVIANETIPYTTIYQDSEELYKGQIEVQSVGLSGSKQMTLELVKENGIIVQETVLAETVLAEPQNQLALKGTSPIPTYTGSTDGTFAAPMTHIEVSSPFGSRGGGRHYGVDLRNPKGTPFSVVADGVVIYADYSGSYGNIIKVDHGDGLQTYYAHCDAMMVSVGDIVTKGQTIGTVGMTGNATGYVLHFEVRKNGVAQNPMNYI